MASHSSYARLILALALAAMPVCLSGARPSLSLEQAASRKPGDFSPAHDGQEATVSGVASAPSIRVLTYAHIGIHDRAGHGLTLDGPPDLLAAFEAGDVVEASGVVGQRGGLPVLFVSEIKKTGSAAAAPPVRVRWRDLNSFRYLGLLVTAEARITEVGENTGGDYLLIGDSSGPLKVFFPLAARSGAGAREIYSLGDKIQVTGISSQYCSIPPYDRMFEILAPTYQSVVLLERSWLVPPYAIVVVLLGVVLGLGLWWYRERHIARQRQATRALNALGEEILAALSPSDILEKLSGVVCDLMGVSDVHLYVSRPGSKALERIAGRNVEGAMIPLAEPEGAVANAAALCFRNRTMLAIPDTARSPLFRGSERKSDPRAAMFVPMLAQGEPLGVLALCHSTRVRAFNQDEQAAAQHFANQVATSLRLMEQRTMREQLFRSEKLAATGQLISGIVDELQAPLESVSAMAGRALARPAEPETKRELAAIASEARRAAEIVSRLLSFARAEKTEARPVEINSLLSSLIKFREREWAAHDMQVSNRLSLEPVRVLGSHGQLEQVFLNLLVHAEQSLASAEHRELFISTSLLARRVLVAISYSGTESGIHRDPFLDPSSPEAGALGLGVCRGIIQSHSGEIRFVRTSGSASRFEVELPVVQLEPRPGPDAAPERGAKQWTALIVEPDPNVQRQLLVHLSARGCRVVPAGPPEEAARMVDRMRFDIVFCSVRLSGMNWLEFFEHVRQRVGVFVLLTEGYDSDLARAFQTGDGHILRKPVDEKELAALLDETGLR